jgi:hypothetical protein
MSGLQKVKKSLRENGVFSTARKALDRAVDIILRRPLQRKNFRAMDRMFEHSRTSRGEVFNFIYKKNVWFMRETKSGPGSTLRQTENARKHIPLILRQFSIKSVYDAPCGDFHWMRLALANSQVDYLGADIVPDLVANDQAKYQTEKIKFVVSDIVVDSFPTVDLWICRDGLIHFSNRDIVSALEKFCQSHTKFVLMTNYTHAQENQVVDIHTGQSRSLDFFSEPFNFDGPVKYRFPDYKEPNPSPREMILLSRDDVIAALRKIRDRIALISKSNLR